MTPPSAPELRAQFCYAATIAALLHEMATALLAASIVLAKGQGATRGQVEAFAAHAGDQTWAAVERLCR